MRFVESGHEIDTTPEVAPDGRFVSRAVVTRLTDRHVDELRPDFDPFATQVEASSAAHVAAVAWVAHRATARQAKGRIDFAARVIKAQPSTIYKAWIDPQALVAWLPPTGMKGRIEAFEAREGGTYRMKLSYERPDHATAGKTTKDADIVRGRFVQLVPDTRIVQLIEFESDDPAFSGVMTMTWTLTAVSRGTEVAITCENVPDGIRAEDHEAGLNSTLANLARFTE